MLTLETGLPDIFLTSLKLHFNFILKLLTGSLNKLTKQIALYTIRKRQFWFKEWYVMAAAYGFDLQLNESNLNEWGGRLNELLNIIHVKNMDNCKERAIGSTTRETYSIIKYNLGELSYFNGQFNTGFISIIFKARGELLRLNYMPYREDLDPNCTMCDIDEKETLFHFLGYCDKLNHIRKEVFNQFYLSQDEMIDLLNGRNWVQLYDYLKRAYDYRTSKLELTNF